MNAARQNAEPNESSLVKLYMDLTGSSECQARNAFMYVCCRERGDEKFKPSKAVPRWENENLARIGTQKFSLPGARLQQTAGMLVPRSVPTMS
jgi:hypothetical protein